MLRIHLKTPRHAGQWLFALLFLLFLVNSPTTAAARPWNAEHQASAASNGQVTQKKQNHRMFTVTGKHAAKIRFASAAAVAAMSVKPVAQSASQGFSLGWLRVAIRSLLIGVWANINAYTGGSSSGGRCTS